MDMNSIVLVSSSDDDDDERDHHHHHHRNIPSLLLHANPTNPQQSNHASTSTTTTTTTTTTLFAQKQHLRERLANYDVELQKYHDQIKSIRALIDATTEERQKIIVELESLQKRALHGGTGGGVGGGGGGGVTGVKGGGGGGGINFSTEEFEWSGGLKKKMKDVFRIGEFRLCQRGVCNANMDERDIICVMPTGGGKSLTYQLPALLQPGCTLVISPLISLITDQILHLQDARVQAVKLTGSSTSKQESASITQRLHAMANGREEDIKLCYVTPEKLSRNKSFLALIHKLVAAGRLARFVIDEAHCVSQLGHDFRPDYEELRMLRQLFPRVPIMALTATCPPKVLRDLLSILGLKPVTDGNNADSQGTVYFTSPLYRKNLHYSVQPKSDRAVEVIKMMCEFILAHHRGESGIVYCLSKKDAENVAEGLKEYSLGKILTGVYHSDCRDRDKEDLHLAWRKGDVKVVCATIAFGLGIDKGDVRFVLHHSLSKSVEGYYQESGRAGRDGKDSDCVLYYRPQDGANVGSMVAREKGGPEKLHAMLKFAQDLKLCRKFQFANYFSHSSDLAMSSWSTDEADALTRCGHCDNCLRGEGEVRWEDVTVDVWRLLRIAGYLKKGGASVTMKMLASLARGRGGGGYEVVGTLASGGGGGGGGGGKGKGKGKGKAVIDLEEVAGGRVELSQEEVEYLIVEMLVQKYLKEEYYPTAYQTYVYLVHGALAPRLAMLTYERVVESVAGGGAGVKVECGFRKVMKPVRAGTGKSRGDKSKDKDKGKGKEKGKEKGKGKEKEKETERGKRRRDEDEDDDEEAFGETEEESGEHEVVDMRIGSGKGKAREMGRGYEYEESGEEEEDDDDDDVTSWMKKSKFRRDSRRAREWRPREGFDSDVEMEDMEDEDDDEDDDDGFDMEWLNSMRTRRVTYSPSPPLPLLPPMKRRKGALPEAGGSGSNTTKGPMRSRMILEDDHEVHVLSE